jgi:hypothetical protein
MAQVWNLPGPARPGYLQRLGRAALFLGVLGFGVIVTTLLTSLGAYGHHAIAIVVAYGHHAIAIVVLLEALAGAASIGMYFTGFRALTWVRCPQPHSRSISWCSVTSARNGGRSKTWRRSTDVTGPPASAATARTTPAHAGPPSGLASVNPLVSGL